MQLDSDEYKAQAAQEASENVPAGYVQVTTGKILKDDKLWNPVSKEWDLITMDGAPFTIARSFFVIRQA